MSRECFACNSIRIFYLSLGLLLAILIYTRRSSVISSDQLNPASAVRILKPQKRAPHDIVKYLGSLQAISTLNSCLYLQWCLVCAGLFAACLHSIRDFWDYLFISLLDYSLKCFLLSKTAAYPHILNGSHPSLRAMCCKQMFELLLFHWGFFIVFPQGCWNRRRWC